MAGPPNPADQSNNSQQQAQQAAEAAQQGQAPVPNPLFELPTVLSANASSLDDLVSSAAKDADRVAGEQKDETKVEDAPHDEKKSKKTKEKTKLIYADKNDISPEEKMAQMPRYAFTPSG